MEDLDNESVHHSGRCGVEVVELDNLVAVEAYLTMFL